VYIGETQFIAGDRIQYSMYYDRFLTAHETLVAASATVVNYHLATIDTVTIETPSSKFFTFYLTGGSAGDTFQINLQVTTSTGQVRNDYMLVVVGPNGAAYSYSASLQGPTGATGAAGSGATGPTGAAVDWANGTLASPPTVAGGTWTNHNFAASTTAADFTEGLTGIRLRTLQPSNATYNFRGLIKSPPSTPYNLIGRFRRQQPLAIANGGSVHHCLGLALYESATGKSLLYGLGNNNASNVSLVRKSMTSNSVLAANFEMWSSAGLSDTPWEWWLKINNDGTDLRFYFSMDGWAWNFVDKLAKSTPFTTAPDKVGWGMLDGWWTVNTDANATPETILDCGGWSCS
jgi:hypothetical protein